MNIIPASRAFQQIKDVQPNINKDDSGRQFPLGVVVHYLSDIHDAMSVIDMDLYNFDSFDKYMDFVVQSNLMMEVPEDRMHELIEEIRVTNTHYVSVRDNVECKFYFLMTRKAY